MNSRCVIAAWLERFQEKLSWCRNEQVSQVRSVRHFERSNGLDTALYKNIIFTFTFCSGHDGTVRIWSLPSRTHHFLRQTCVFNYGDHLREERHEQQLGLVRWNGNGKLLAGAINNMLNIWLVAGTSHV